MEGLRRSAWLVVAAAVVPLLLFLVFQTGFAAREQRRTIEAQALARSESVSLAADGEFKRIDAGLDALATGTALRAGDLAGFRARATELNALYAGWRGVELVDLATGRPLLTTAPPGRRVTMIAAGSPSSASRLVGFVRGPGCPCLLFDRIANGPPGRHWALRITVDMGRFLSLLPPARGQYEVSAIVEPRGRFIARTIGAVERFGTPGSHYLRESIATGRAHGIYPGYTLEGFQNYTAFTRSPLTGWSSHVALGSTYIDNPARRFLASVGLAALLALLLAVVLVWFALRQVREGRQVAERMQQAQKLEALGQLTGGIAHDFNNLLTPIIGALDHLAHRTELDPRNLRYALGALASAERAGKLTAQLLAFSRRQKLSVEPIDVAGMLDEMGDMFRQAVADTHQLEIHLDGRPLCALGDLNQLELAILNLVLNARDASPAGSVIRVAVVGEDAGAVRIAVRDEGHGMDAETQRRATEPFFTTKPAGSGTGLGLAQVFGMAEQTGGRVEIDSAPGAGTTVTLCLPRCAPSALRRLPARSLLPDPAAPLRLLVVDDDPAVRAAIVRPLEEAGHLVDAVSDGATALAAIGQRRFDLVLVDFAMPGMTGAELIAAAQAVRPDARFLIVSGYSDSAAIAEAAADTPLIRKPFDAAQLLETVEQLAR